ncbi:efflux RND transporter periplasmic adaptor subunit [Helicobacter sp. MIT 14-3879]|uniref:efflux RND transporter periplasmic adaptor subunit n=1 Tax=Helicobacter sp. MIT 14-3879 TaxID=2040649 RepID=UPI000E1F8354|nr:efflux RND transporter periplasmic adaptor subunit [Helicobacter sp. MIT 14-3879]RDU65542.1 efflux RND transporter periplasmic adaptor subunit [Helicobacter sp. MIT 14-3879]
MAKIYERIKSKNKGRKKIFIVLALLVLLIILVAVYFIKYNKKEINYITQNPTIEDISQDVSATGTLSPTNTVDVGSQISGRILEVLVDVNDEVKKGQVLAKIDPEKLNQAVDNYLAQLQSAKAELYSAEVNLENKKWTYDNYLDLYNKTDGKSPSQLQLKTAELDYKSALANIEIRKASIKQLETSLNSARIDVKNSIITSPTNGIILSRSIDPGQTVAANFETPTLFTIAQDLTKMKLISSVLEADIGKVKIGQEVEFSVDAYPNEKFQAKVSKVNFADSSSTNTSNSTNSSSTSTNIISYEVTTYVDNSKLLLRPGMSATANIKTALAKNALLIPYQALLFKPNSNIKAKQQSSIMMGPPKRIRRSYSSIGSQGSIWILEDNEAKNIDVDIGITNGKSAQVLSDNINKDTKVIIQIQN